MMRELLADRSVRYRTSLKPMKTYLRCEDAIGTKNTINGVCGVKETICQTTGLKIEGCQGGS
jgi:hypothetical protein